MLVNLKLKIGILPIILISATEFKLTGKNHFMLHSEPGTIGTEILQEWVFNKGRLSSLQQPSFHQNIFKIVCFISLFSVNTRVISTEAELLSPASSVTSVTQ